MRIVVRQDFPLGRFHATPWRVNPFDDPFGEWPPSPWRFVRAVVARWYQWARESSGQFNKAELSSLIRSLCESEYAFYLPPLARRGPAVRQYFPSEFGWEPQVNTKAGMRCYRRSLAQDNFWCTAPNEQGAVWWFLEREVWSQELLYVLDRCLERITYFGRAETFSRLRRSSGEFPSPNCKLVDQPSRDAVPVLVPTRDATEEDLLCTTEDPRAIRRSVPPGARYRYAVLPPPMIGGKVFTVDRRFTGKQLLQFAVGWNVAPTLRSLVRLTSRLRGAVLRESLRCHGFRSVWARAPRDVRERVALIAGKDSDGRPLQGHRHAEFFVWLEGRLPTRLLVWRSEPFLAWEEEAILRAASREVSWANPGDDTDAWKVRLLPLDRAVPPPEGFDGQKWRVWESMTPYVPPRRYLRGSKLRARETIEHQVRRELTLRGYPCAEDARVSDCGRPPTWVAVHLPRRAARERAFLGDRRGYWLRLELPQPVEGPLRLGHSASFGLGLFKPVG